MNKLINKSLMLAYAMVLLGCNLAFASTDSNIIQEIIEHKLTIEKSAVGVSVAIIENDRVEYLNFGLTNKEKKIATNSKSLFEIGSISKTFTSMALASMVKEGKVKLTDPVQQFLPSNVKMPKRNGEAITLLTLANHTSALPRLPNNMPFGDVQDPYADYTVEMMYEFLNGYELPRDIGEKLEYSNLAFGLLGHALELIDNKTYQQVIANRVLKPLSMQSTFVDVPQSHIKMFSDGHDATLNKTKHWQLPTLAGAGAIRSNIKDMALYLKANLNQTPLKDAISLTHKQTTSLDGQGPKVGLGWFINETENGSYLWHTGGTGGFRTFIGFNKENQKGIVILENTANGMDAIGDAFLTGSLNKLKSDTLDVVKVDEEKLKRLNGHFELMPGFIMHVTSHGQQLFIQATGQGRFPATAKSDLEFVNVAAQARITFELDDKGQATSLTLFQGGQAKKAIKLSADEVADKSKKVELTKTQLDNLIGEYQITPNFVITTTHKDGQLIIQATGQPQIPFETKSASEFFNGQLQTKILFELDGNGKALSLTLFQAGQELNGVKK